MLTEKLKSKNPMHRYHIQGVELPVQISQQLEGLKQSILVYCGIDLSPSSLLVEEWLVGTNDFVYHFAAGELVESISMAEIETITIKERLTIQKLIIGLKDGTFKVYRYSHRQKRAVGQLYYLVEQKINHQPVGDLKYSANELYERSMLKEVSSVQGRSAHSQTDVFWRLLRYIYPYKKMVTLGVIGAIMLTLLALVPAYLTGYILDHVIKPFKAGELEKAVAYRYFYFAMGGLVFVYTLRQFFSWMRLKNMSIMGEAVARDIRNQLYTHLHKLSVGYFSSKPTGSLISRVSSDTDRLWDFIAFGILEVFTSIIMLLGLSAVLIYLDWRLGLMISLPIPLIIWAIVLHGQRMRATFLICWRRWSKITDCVSDTLPGIRVVKAFNKSQQEVSRFKKRNKEAYETFSGVHEMWTRFWPLLMLSINALVLCVWLFGVPRILGSNYTFFGGELSTGEFVSFVIYMTMLVQPIEVIGQVSRMMNRATSSAHRVFEVLDTEPTEAGVENSTSLKNIKGDIKFKNVDFSYDGLRRILKDVNFEIKAGEMVGLVGPSGGGKTTIINLIARFYEPSKGCICIDGQDVKQINTNDLRENIGMVLQDPYLFNGSVFENIRYGCSGATNMQVIKAAMAANAHEFIMRFPYGYDTVVGERGHTLSGGERQRISIARAILRNPKILILDEATSAVDTETERKIQQALDHLVKGRTVIAIAHRLSTLAKANRLFVIKNGEVVERGTHQELIQNDQGVYKKLVEMQLEISSIKTVEV